MENSLNTHMTFSWRAMVIADLDAVVMLADRIHVNYPEAREVLAEKQRIFPAGCFVLAGKSGEVRGYCFSHPWAGAMPPALNRLLQNLPNAPTDYFIHDVALSEEERGKARVQELLPRLIDIARDSRLPRLILIAVSGSLGFWRRLGFVATNDTFLQDQVRNKYGPEAVHMGRPTSIRISP